MYSVLLILFILATPMLSCTNKEFGFSESESLIVTEILDREEFQLFINDFYKYGDRHLKNDLDVILKFKGLLCSECITQLYSRLRILSFIDEESIKIDPNNRVLVFSIKKNILRTNSVFNIEKLISVLNVSGYMPVEMQLLVSGKLLRKHNKVFLAVSYMEIPFVDLMNEQKYASFLGKFVSAKVKITFYLNNKNAHAFNLSHMKIDTKILDIKQL